MQEQYVLRPKQSFLEIKRGSIDMVAEGMNVLEILTNKDRFPRTRENLIQYKINTSKKEIEFTLLEELDKRIYDFLDKSWEITTQ